MRPKTSRSIAADFKLTKAYRVYNAFSKIQNVRATNPLAIEYFSISPFQHGLGQNSQVVKYKVTPCKGVWFESVDRANPNFLQHQLKNTLRADDACFSFQVQKLPKYPYNRSPYKTQADKIKYATKKIENPTIPWHSPFKEFARIHIPAQDPVDDQTCDRSVINPWNTLPQHQPLGGINRLRLAAYLFSIEMRNR